MCILLLNFNMRRDLPVVVAANRDEYYDRPSEPPQLLNTNPCVLGGRDGRAGGTWLGVNEFGLVAALTNRHTPTPPRPQAPSRGILCAMVLRSRNAAEAIGHVAGHILDMHYNPFSMVVVDTKQAWSMTNFPEWEVKIVPPGWHALGNTALDSGNDPRVVRARELVTRISPVMPREQVGRELQKLCRDHGRSGDRGRGEDTLCMHGNAAGTRSSSILLIDAAGRVADYWHADGPPCSSAFYRVQVPWQKTAVNTQADRNHTGE